MKKFGKALVFGILCLILTFAITVQLRVSSLSESESSQTKITDKLKDEIFRLNDENVKLAEKFQNTTSELDDARNQAAQNDSSSKDTSELIKKYTIVSGKTDVTGQGIIIKYKPSDNEAKADMVKDLRDIVNEIKNAGAEAIEINNQRIVGTTAIEMVKNKIEINDTEVSENFIIKAIGDSNLMYSGLIRPGGTIENIKESGVSIEINSENAIKINKYNEI
jgi:predicted division initiation protein